MILYYKDKFIRSSIFPATINNARKTSQANIGKQDVHRYSFYLFNLQLCKNTHKKFFFIVKPIRPGQSYSASSQVTVKGGSVSYSSPSHLSASEKPTSNSVSGYQTVLDRLSNKGSSTATKPIKVGGGLSPTNPIRKNSSGDITSFQYPPATNSTQNAVQRPRKTSNENISFQPPTSASSRRPIMQSPDNFGAFKTIKSDPHAK